MLGLLSTINADCLLVFRKYPNIELETKSHKSWVRVLNNPNRLKYYGLSIDKNKGDIIIMIKCLKNKRINLQLGEGHNESDF